VPGIDCAFLAMDTEEGVEVVWNEVRISEKKSSKVQLVSNSGFLDSFNCLVIKYSVVAAFVLLRMSSEVVECLSVSP